MARSISCTIRGLSDDVVLEFPQPVVPLRHVRGTLLIGSVATLREAGYFESYARVVAPEVLKTIEASVAAMWIPVETALAHYDACDSIGLSAESCAQLGRSTFMRTKGMLMGTATALARTAGASPWTFAPHLQRFWMRGYDGGGIQVLRKGPKEMHMEVVQCALGTVRYYRNALRGLTCAVYELVAKKVYVSERPPSRPASPPGTSIAFRVQWV
jgi:hypothetical protein